MPDPNWTYQYNFGQTPEQNGFTRELYNSPVLTIVTTGPQASRRVEINSNNGDAVFKTSNVPALDPAIGATLETTVAVSGAGDAGFELTFLNRAVLVMIYASQIILSWCSDQGGQPEIIVPTVSNSSNTIIRGTFDSSMNLRVYRAGALASGPHLIPVCVKPFQRVLWWGEGGGTQIFRAMKYFQGGAVAPG